MRKGLQRNKINNKCWFYQHLFNQSDYFNCINTQLFSVTYSVLINNKRITFLFPINYFNLQFYKSYNSIQQVKTLLLPMFTANQIYLIFPRYFSLKNCTNEV